MTLKLSKWPDADILEKLSHQVSSASISEKSTGQYLSGGPANVVASLCSHGVYTPVWRS